MAHLEEAGLLPIWRAAKMLGVDLPRMYELINTGAVAVLDRPMCQGHWRYLIREASLLQVDPTLKISEKAIAAERRLGAPPRLTGRQLELPPTKPTRRPWGTGAEGVIELALFERLEKAGKSPRAQVKVATGIVDILTDDAIYEVKATLYRTAIFQAMGQLMAYQTGLRKRRLIIVGRDGDGVGLIPHIEQIGFTVEVWEDAPPSAGRAPATSSTDSHHH